MLIASLEKNIATLQNENNECAEMNIAMREHNTDLGEENGRLMDIIHKQNDELNISNNQMNEYKEDLKSVATELIKLMITPLDGIGRWSLMLIHPILERWSLL